MKLKPKITIIDHFANLTAPRIEHTKEHKLIDIVLNLLRQEQTAKLGIENKRLKAAWDNNYLIRVLALDSHR